MNQENKISNEDDNLSGMAPKLSGLKKKNPFHPSDKYFQEFESKLADRISDMEEIKGLAPSLLNIPKYNPFDVPADYFEDLPSAISERIVRTSGTSFKEWLMLLVRPRFVLPFTTIVIMAVSGINYMNRNAESIAVDTEELSLEDHLYYVDETAIIEQYADDIDVQETVAEDTGIEDYLIDNNIDETDL